MSNCIIHLFGYINATCLRLTGFICGFDSKQYFIVTTDKMTEPNPISEGIIQELLTTVKGLQAEMAELKSGATGGSNPPTNKSGCSTLPEGSNVRGNPQKRQLPEEEAGSSDDENPLTDEEEGGTTFSLSEEGDAFVEAGFKSRLENDSREKGEAWVSRQQVVEVARTQLVYCLHHPQGHYQSRFYC